MNIIERQNELGRSLFEINTNTLRELASLQRENVEKYFETNRSFGERLPEVKSLSDFLNLQREYGETLWNNTREAVESQNEIFKSAFKDTAEAMKTALSPEEEAEAPKRKSRTKAKPKAKKPATESSH